MSNPNAEVNALLGRGSEFEGKLTFEGTVRIDGKFTGEILSNDTLIIGEGARVRAEIDVANVIVYGEVDGNIRAMNSCELHSPAKLTGNITAPALVIDQGVVFDGNCSMTKPESRMPQRTPATEAPAPPAPSTPTTDEPAIL